MKEKVQTLKIINALFLEPHTRCYVMYAFLFVSPQRDHFYVINKFYFCLGVGAEGLGVNSIFQNSLFNIITFTDITFIT